jgi:hypothetical protein
MMNICSESQPEPAWAKTIGEVATNHAQVAGILGGFSVASFILLLQLQNSESIDFNTQIILGLFLLAMFGFIYTSILYSVTIHQSQQEEEQRQFFVFIASGYLYLFSAIVSFTAFHFLIKYHSLDSLEYLTKIMIIGSLIGGYFSVWMPIEKLLRVEPVFGIAIFFLALTVAWVVTPNIPHTGAEVLIKLLFGIGIFMLASVFGFATMTHTYLECFTRTRNREAMTSLVTLFITTVFSICVVIIAFSLEIQKT